MKSQPSPHVSRNSDPVYNATLPSRPAALPPTERRIVAGVETSREYSRPAEGIFGRQVRHYNMIVRKVSAPAVTLSPYSSAELEGAVLLACGEDGVDVREGIPSITKGCSFRVTRSADLFIGGTLRELTPGVYSAGDTIVDAKSGRLYLELVQQDKISFAVVGLFMQGRLPSCVDWRVIGPV